MASLHFATDAAPAEAVSLAQATEVMEWALKEVAFSKDEEITEWVELAKVAQARAEKAEEERDVFRNLLELQRQTVRDCIDSHDGRDYHDSACGNCIAGVPLAHSLGCRIKSALRGGK